MPMSWPICWQRINEVVCLACAARLLPRGIVRGIVRGVSPSYRFGTARHAICGLLCVQLKRFEWHSPKEQL
jgi:hypothetical protein